MEFSKESETNGLFSLLNKEMAVLKEILLSRIDKMRLAIEEAETLSGSEIQQWDELKNGLETKIATLKGQLQEKEEGLHVRESALKEREESLTTKLHDLERRLTEKEDLLSLLEKRNAEITNLRAEAEKKVGTLEGQLQEKEEGLHVRESALKEREESLTTKLHDLERRLGEKEALLEVRETEVNDLRSKADVLNVPPQGLITLREEDAVAVRGSEEEGGRARPGTRDGKEAEGQERMAAEMQRLTAELQEKDVLLSAREMEVKMVKQSMEERVKELERIVKRQVGEEQKKSRLVSYVHIDKGN